MMIACATSNEPDPRRAAAEAAETVRTRLGDAPVDLAFLFASHGHAPAAEEVARAVHDALSPRHLAGATGEAIIGGRLEHEGVPAITVWAGALPGAAIASSAITAAVTPDGFAFPGAPEVPDGPATMILLGDPYSFPADRFVERAAEDHPDLQVLGGMASGASGPGESRLFHGAAAHESGAVATVISGSLRVRPLVSQGCRPFGKRHVITRAERNVVFTLGGRPALEKLAEELREMTPDERSMLERGLHLGLAIDARKERHERGDFLIRNVVGFARDEGAIVITDAARPGTTVQFHLRDAETASEDLDVLLREAKTSGSRPLGGLLFSCNGRGSRLFDAPHHDAGSIARGLGEFPLAGFFAAGEIGPVGGRNFLHGFTASIALFEERAE
jgi:small ligand-binding sensory domain FIST